MRPVVRIACIVRHGTVEVAQVVLEKGGCSKTGGGYDILKTQVGDGIVVDIQRNPGVYTE